MVETKLLSEVVDTAIGVWTDARVKINVGGTWK